MIGCTAADRLQRRGNEGQALGADELDPLVVSGHAEAPMVGGGFAVVYPPSVRGIDLSPEPPGSVLAHRELAVAGIRGGMGELGP